MIVLLHCVAALLGGTAEIWVVMASATMSR
jgi:hypothetical protein